MAMASRPKMTPLLSLLLFLLGATQAYAKLPLWPWQDPFQSSSSTGCSIAHASGFNNDTSTHYILSSGTDRYYAVYVPKSYQAGTPTPLIFDYHASSKTPWDQYDNSQYYADPTGQDYLVVYPQGLNNSWEGASYANANAHDLQFTTDLLAHVKAQYCVDAARVYASGKSNGGGFVNTLACSPNGDDFAAFAMASAALYTDTSAADCAAYKRAILESHGLKDTTVAYTGGNGNGGTLPNIAQWVSWWGESTCGNGAAAQTNKTNAYTTTTYSCGSWQDVIQHYEVNALGHCWPSANGDNYDATVSPTTCSDRVLDFTAAVVAFFGTWNLNNAPTPQ